MLEQLADWRPPLQVCPHRLDYDEAVRWFSEYREVSIEGVVAKVTTAQYAPGQTQGDVHRAGFVWDTMEKNISSFKAMFEELAERIEKLTDAA